jgi:hypothetical protein
MTDARDIFGSGGGGGDFPKIDELNGKLVLLTPSKQEEVAKPKDFGGKPGETQTRITADVVVFDDNGEVSAEYEDMYFSQVGIVNPCKRALKPGAKRFVLGVVARVPSKIGKSQAGKFDSTEKIEAGLKDHFASNGKKEKHNFSWGLTDFSDEQGEAAKMYVLSKSPVMSGAETAAE